MASSLPPPPQWVLDLNNDPVHTKTIKTTGIPDPPGYTSTASTSKKTSAAKGAQTISPRKDLSPEAMDSLKLKKAWEVAIAPAKSLPMNAIGMYMTGNSLQIFSIFMVFQLFKTPLTALANINTTFSRFETETKKQDMIIAKLAFVACNLLALGLGVYKVNAMGLLPTTQSDWLAWEKYTTSEIPQGGTATSNVVDHSIACPKGTSACTAFDAGHTQDRSDEVLRSTNHNSNGRTKELIRDRQIDGHAVSREGQTSALPKQLPNTITRRTRQPALRTAAAGTARTTDIVEVAMVIGSSCTNLRTRGDGCRVRLGEAEGSIGANVRLLPTGHDDGHAAAGKDGGVGDAGTYTRSGGLVRTVGGGISQEEVLRAGIQLLVGQGGNGRLNNVNGEGCLLRRVLDELPVAAGVGFGEVTGVVAFEGALAADDRAEEVAVAGVLRGIFWLDGWQYAWEEALGGDSHGRMQARPFSQSPIQTTPFACQQHPGMFDTVCKVKAGMQGYLHLRLLLREPSNPVRNALASFHQQHPPPAHPLTMGLTTRRFPSPFRVGTDIANINRFAALIHGARTGKRGPNAILALTSRFMTPHEVHDFFSYHGTEASWKLPQGLSLVNDEHENKVKRISSYLAGRWAAKEAVIKAVKPRRLTMRDIEVRRDAKTEEVFAVVIDPPVPLWQRNHYTAITDALARAEARGEASQVATDNPREVARWKSVAEDADHAPPTSALDQEEAPFEYEQELEGQVATISISHDGDYVVAVALAVSDFSEGQRDIQHPEHQPHDIEHVSEGQATRSDEFPNF
ncbi:hypothetical protein FH972_023783 [Carpinus fangiana]|uniref:ER membrane protein complex subunit 4 n=1 Tax=Carpinus fangiana TaxID=176857 RepID=A0A5N6KWU5_9ROSI|nr:hypothetical protein FH972_023783 [Carpinus fangiana]